MIITIDSKNYLSIISHYINKFILKMDLPFLRPGQTSSPLITTGTSTFKFIPSSAQTNTKFKIFPLSSSL